MLRYLSSLDGGIEYALFSCFNGVEINHLGILNNNRKNIFSKLLGSGNCMLRATSCVKDCGWTARAFAVSWAFWAF